MQNPYRRATSRNGIPCIKMDNIEKEATNIWAIYESDLFSIKIPFPLLEKQKEIVKFLNVQFEAFEKIRKLRKNTEKMIKIILRKEVFGNE
jgi:restriction endonuclease S subunit